MNLHMWVAGFMVDSSLYPDVAAYGDLATALTEVAHRNSIELGQTTTKDNVD